MIWALELPILLSLLNHFGGQGYGRVLFRMILMPLSVGVAATFMGYPLDKCLEITAICLAGFSFWAVWKNGPEFMSLNSMDYRLYNTPWYTPNIWLTKLCDSSMGVSQHTLLTPAQCREWGTIYGCLLGAFFWPMFIGLSFIVTPIAGFIGLSTCIQGVVYRYSKQVPNAEYIWGGFLGVLIASILIMGNI